MVVSHRVPNPASTRKTHFPNGAKSSRRPNRCFVNTRYDAEGNMTSKTRVSDGESWTYTWDDRNRLTQVVEKTSGGVTVTNDVFTYDVENRRIGKSVNGTQSWYGYDGQNSYADFNGSGSLTMRYLTGQALDSLYARFDGTSTGWYLTDILASVRLIVTTAGTTLDSLSYDSYGQILSESNSANGDRFKYTGRECDSELGEYYYRARAYSALDGRFRSQDPLGFKAGDTNTYRYVQNRPGTATDPTGTELYAAIAGIVFGFAIGAAVGGWNGGLGGAISGGAGGLITGFLVGWGFPLPLASAAGSAASSGISSWWSGDSAPRIFVKIVAATAIGVFFGAYVGPRLQALDSPVLENILSGGSSSVIGGGTGVVIDVGAGVLPAGKKVFNRLVRDIEDNL